MPLKSGRPLPTTFNRPAPVNRGDRQEWTISPFDRLGSLTSIKVCSPEKGAPSDSTLTVYDEEHAVTYLRMLPGMHAARGH
jgi:hypothetical protein